MQNQRFAWPEQVMPKITLLVLVLLHWSVGCSGQEPKEQPQNKTAVVVDTTKEQVPSQLLVRPNKAYIASEWDSATEGYYYAFYDKKGKVVKRLTEQEITAKDEFENLPFPVLPKPEGEQGPKDYTLGNLKLGDRSKALSKGNAPLFPQRVLEQAHQLKTFGVATHLHGFMPDIPNGGFQFMTQKSTIWAVDSIAESLLFSKTVVKVFNVKGEQIARVEENEDAKRILLSDDARFLLMENYKTILGYEWEQARKPYMLIDLKENKKYCIPIDFPDFASSNGMAFLEGKYFHFDFLDQYRLHVLIDPYRRITYSKKYLSNDRGFSNPDLSTYTQTPF